MDASMDDLPSSPYDRVVSRWRLGAGAAIVTPEASPGVTPCGCRIQPTQFFQ